MPQSSHDAVTIRAVGDVGVTSADSNAAFDAVKPILERSDVLFGQLETNITDARSRYESYGVSAEDLADSTPRFLTDPDVASVYRDAGFDVLSHASNHCLDWGIEGFLDTIDRLEENGIYPLGVGGDIDEARTPAVFERGGTTIAVLGYNSVDFPSMEFPAKRKKPGCAPMRVRTSYALPEISPNRPDVQPGIPIETATEPVEEDIERMVADVKAAADRADVVIVSLHWGVHFEPDVLADYQPEVGHAAIDAGADAIVGHHPHVPQGVEMYEGKPIFYSLGNFALELPARLSRKRPASTKSMIVTLRVANGGLGEVSFLPCVVDDRSRPRPLDRSDDESREIVEYVDERCRNADFDTTLRYEGDEVVVSQ